MTVHMSSLVEVVVEHHNKQRAGHLRMSCAIFNEKGVGHTLLLLEASSFTLPLIHQ